MTKHSWPMLAAIALLAGCAQQAPVPQDPAAAIAATRNGTASLACGNGLSCSLRWQNVQNTALQDAVGQQWESLAALVVGAGYDADISWYYLGQAAQGMGSYDAARLYFNNAMRDAAAGGASACAGGLIDLCNGVALPNDARMLLSQVPSGEPVAATTRRRTTTTRHTAPTASKSSNFVPPVATPAPPPAAAPAAGSGTDFVAPVAPPPPAAPPAPPAPPSGSEGFVAPVQ